jgi:hypothetical protein
MLEMRLRRYGIAENSNGTWSVIDSTRTAWRNWKVIFLNRVAFELANSLMHLLNLAAARSAGDPSFPSLH